MAGLSSAVVKCQGQNFGGKLLCLELRCIKDMYVCECMWRFHITWYGNRVHLGMRQAAGINMPKYILTNAFDVPVRIELAP